MAADAVLMETLLRIEHKLDLLLSDQGPKEGSFLFNPVGSSEHYCPVCTNKVEYVLDALNKVVARKCGCSTGKIAPIDLRDFAPPAVDPRQRMSDGNATVDQEDKYNQFRGSRRQR